jgi:Tol biopolymer transport system component
VTFYSAASNLVPGDTNERADVFVHDVESGATERVSVASDGAEASAGSLGSSVSENGRFVAFESAAPNLVPEDTNGSWDVFVRDRQASITRLVSVGPGGVPGNNDAFAPSISADGNRVAFYSDASNLVPDDTNGAPDVFVHDLTTGITERASVATDGSQGVGHPPPTLGTPSNGGSYFPSLSADGRHVSFWSSAANLVPDDTNERTDVFVHDLETAVTERVSVGPEEETNGHSYTSSISADGRYIAFESWASNLVPSDINKAPDIFIYDRDASVTERVSIGVDGVEGNGYSFSPSISADGRHIAFDSVASNLVPGDTGASDAFVHDRETGTTRRASSAPGGSTASGGSSSPSLSADGRFIAFVSESSDLVPGDLNAVSDAFVHDLGHALGVQALSVAADGSHLSVSGWATFSGLAVASTTDDPNDGSPGAAQAGGELAGAEVIHRPEQEDLLFRLGVQSLPGVTVQRCARTPTFPPVTACAEESTRGGAPGVVYGFAFDSGDSHYEIRGTRAGGVPPSADPHFALYECEVVCLETASLSGGLGTTGNEMLVSVPLAAFEAENEVAITAIEAFTSIGSGLRLDGITLSDAVISTPIVALGVAPTSTPEEDVAYTTATDLVAGHFSAAMDVSSLAPGDYLLWARGCLADSCGSHPIPFTVAGDLIETSVQLDLQRVRGDFVAIATLSESDGRVPLPGAEISFFVNGEEIGIRATDANGRAQITLSRSQFHAHDVLRAAFAGDGSHKASFSERGTSE